MRTLLLLFGCHISRCNNLVNSHKRVFPLGLGVGLRGAAQEFGIDSHNVGIVGFGVESIDARSNPRAGLATTVRFASNLTVGVLAF